MADFTNIDGVYAKDTELRSGIDTLRTTVLSNTIKPLTVTKNGTYTAIPSSGTYGYSPIIVDVQEEPWQPLQDGYTNFWFDLTNDTLSPWLNFSAKNAGATIDWGDGSGEQALTTLTPTHTYSKAGRYVVKVKGVTGIDRQYTEPYTNYMYVLKYAELNSDITSLSRFAFSTATGLEEISLPSALSTVNPSMFERCTLLKNIDINISTIPIYTFSGCYSLYKAILGSATTTISNNSFRTCVNLHELHIQATVPPTLDTNVFDYANSSFIIYVPVGYGDTYKSAAGWSTYADHIVEEGQSLSMAALRRIQAEKNNNGEEMR